MKRIRVGIARLLTKGTDCTVVRQKAIDRMKQSAFELQTYVDKSGALNDTKWIHAWRRVFGLTSEILSNADKTEVAP